MKRRAVLAVPPLLVATHARAGVIDWFNGVRVGSTLPEFDAEFIGSAPASEYKLLLLDFWATWCAPCRNEFPHLNTLHERFNGHGLSVVGLTMESRAVTEAFLPKVSLSYTVGAAGQRPLQKLLGIKALPYALLANRKREVVWRGQASSLEPSAISRMLQSAA